MKKMEICLGVKDDATYDTDSLIAILADITFNLININLTVKKDTIGIQGPGFANIGYVTKFVVDEEDDAYYFEVVVFEKYVEAVEKLGVTVLVPRVFTNRENQVYKVIGLDIESINEEAYDIPAEDVNITTEE